MLPMNFFYRAVNSDIAAAVMAVRPKTLREAVSYAISYERNIRNNIAGLPPKKRSVVTPISMNNFPIHTDDPMEVGLLQYSRNVTFRKNNC
jgi:hypothetical protein